MAQLDVPVSSNSASSLKLVVAAAVLLGRRGLGSLSSSARVDVR